MHFLHIREEDRRLLARIVQEARSYLNGRLDDPYQTSLSVCPDAPAGAAQLIRICLEQFLISLYRRYKRKTVPELPAGLAPSPDKTIKENADEEAFTRISRYLAANLSAHLSISRICSDNLIGRSRLQKLFFHLSSSLLLCRRYQRLPHSGSHQYPLKCPDPDGYRQS